MTALTEIMEEKTMLESIVSAASQVPSKLLKVQECEESFSVCSGWIDSAHSVTRAVWGLLESQWVSALLKGHSKTCNKLLSFYQTTVYSVLLAPKLCACTPCPTSQTLFWVASISAICTSLTACVPTQPKLSLAWLRSLASFLIRLFIPAYFRSISWPSLSCGGLDW